MRKHKLYEFHELAHDAQQEAASHVQNQVSETEDWDMHHQNTKDEIVYWIQQKTGQDNTDVEWDTNSYGFVSMTKFDAPISEEEAKTFMTEKDLKAYQDVEAIEGKDLYTEQYDDEEWCTDFEMAIYNQKTEALAKYMKSWLKFLRKQVGYNSGDFEEKWKEARFEIRMSGKEDSTLLDYLRELPPTNSVASLIKEVEEAARKIISKLDKAYCSAYEKLKEEAERRIKKSQDYIDSSDYYFDQLKDGGFDEYRFLVDGGLVELDDMPVVECEECWGKEDLKDMAFTENNGNVQYICQECANLVPLNQ